MKVTSDTLLKIASMASNASIGCELYISYKKEGRDMDEKVKKYIQEGINLAKTSEETFGGIIFMDKIKEGVLTLRELDVELNVEKFEKMLENKLPIDDAEKLKNFLDFIGMDSLLRYRRDWIDEIRKRVGGMQTGTQ